MLFCLFHLFIQIIYCLIKLSKVSKYRNIFILYIIFIWIPFKIWSSVSSFESSMEIKFFNIYSMMEFALQISELQLLFAHTFCHKTHYWPFSTFWCHCALRQSHKKFDSSCLSLGAGLGKLRVRESKCGCDWGDAIVAKEYGIRAGQRGRGGGWKGAQAVATCPCRLNLICANARGE